MGVRYFGPGNTSEGFSLSLSDLDQTTADAFGSQPGLVMSFAFFTFDGVAQSLLSNDSERFSIDPNGVTGDLVLELRFDDLANQMSAAVSLDGGTIFQTPFATRSANLLGGANFFLFGDPVTLPEPSTGLLMTVGLAMLVARRKR